MKSFYDFKKCMIKIEALIGKYLDVGVKGRNVIGLE
jgi:hypothetical protein